MFPKVQFHFSLVMLMGNKMENGNTGGKYSFIGAQPSLVEVYQSGLFMHLVGQLLLQLSILPDSMTFPLDFGLLG